MKHIIFVFLIVSANDLSAQKHIIGVRGGTTTSNIISENPWMYKNENMNRIFGGVSYQYILNKNIYLGADLIYNQKGYSVPVVYTNDQGEVIKIAGYIDYKYDYLSLPLFLGFKVGNRLNAFAHLGLMPSHLVYAEVDNSNYNDPLIDMFQINSDITKSVSKFDLTPIAELGIGFNFTDRIGLNVSATYHHSVTSITNDNYFANSKVTFYGLMYGARIMYTLGN